ncbi:hypothetical protein BK010_06635 [Tenericutes bacterium MO-XQ]|nr:hypothetical protein BK010_06635 [Tenericutes bacterium MO-XQ]
MKFIKDFSNKIDVSIRMVILFIFLGFAVYDRIGNYGGFLPALEVYAPIALISIGIAYLLLKGKEFAAHASLFMFAYLSGAFAFINSILSLRFKPFGLGVPLSWEIIVAFLGFVYLLLMALSLYLKNSKPQKIERKDIALTAVIAFTFFFLRSGFFTAVNKLLLPVISLFFGLPLPTILFLAAGVIDVPFDFIDRLINTNLLSISIGYYLFSFFAFYLIFGAVKGIIGELKK